LGLGFEKVEDWELGDDVVTPSLLLFLFVII